MSVCGTVTPALASGFSCSPRPTPLGAPRGGPSPSPLGHRGSAFPPGPSLPASTPCMLTLVLPHEVPASLISVRGGTGLTTRNPSPTAHALGLGPPHPQRNNRAAEPSGLRCGGFSPPTTLLIPAFALPHAPPRVTPKLRRRVGRSPTQSVPLVPLPRRRWLFQGWLLLSQPPGCLRAATTFPTEPALGDLSRRSGLFASRRRIFAPAASLHGHAPAGIRRLSRVGRWDTPAPQQRATPGAATPRAAPQCISGRTS